MLGPHKNRNGHWVRKSLDRFRPQVQMCDDCFLTFFPHTVKDVLRIGLVLRYPHSTACAGFLSWNSAFSGTVVREFFFGKRLFT